jgi:hypothetical protein
MAGGHREAMQLAAPRPRHHVAPVPEHELDVGAGQRIDARNEVGLDAGLGAVVLKPDVRAPAGVAAEEDLGMRGQPVLFGLRQLDSLARGGRHCGQPEQQGQQDPKDSDGIHVVWLFVTVPAEAAARLTPLAGAPAGAGCARVSLG